MPGEADGPTFDVLAEAEQMAGSVQGNPVIIGIFCLVLPLAVLVAIGRTVLTFGLNSLLQYEIGIPAAAVTALLGYWFYRGQSSTGPTRVRISGGSLRFMFDDGRTDNWELSRLGSVLLLAVHGPRGETLTFRKGGSSTPVPFIQRGLGRRYALSNQAVEAVKERLIGLGRTPKITHESLPAYTGTRIQFTSVGRSERAQLR